MILQDIFNKALTLPKDFPRGFKGIAEIIFRAFSARKKFAGIPVLTGVVLAILAMSCSKWTETESVRIDTVLPWEQDPELWEDYKAAIRD